VGLVNFKDKHNISHSMKPLNQTISELTGISNLSLSFSLVVVRKVSLYHNKNQQNDQNTGFSQISQGMHCKLAEQDAINSTPMFVLVFRW
jgi:hypothetical protein